MNRDSSKKLNFHQSARPGGLRNIAQRVEQLCWIPESFHSFLRKSNWQRYDGRRGSDPQVPSQRNVSQNRRGHRCKSGRSDFSLTERKSHYSHTLLKRPVEMQGVSNLTKVIIYVNICSIILLREQA